MSRTKRSKAPKDGELNMFHATMFERFRTVSELDEPAELKDLFGVAVSCECLTVFAGLCKDSYQRLLANQRRWQSQYK